MKPLYAFLILYALFITGLADGISMALLGIGAVPGSIPVLGSLVASVTGPIGIVLGLVVCWSINVTMGAGLILLLVINGMFHPKIGPASIVGGFIPGLDAAPFWLGLVIAGIIYDAKKEGGLISATAGVATTVQSPSLKNIKNDIMPRTANDNAPQAYAQAS